MAGGEGGREGEFRDRASAKEEEGDVRTVLLVVECGICREQDWR